MLLNALLQPHHRSICMEVMRTTTATQLKTASRTGFVGQTVTG
jgi:hypothetical protein